MSDKRTPVFETTFLETIAIRKFIEMSIEDIKQQTLVASKTRTKDFKAIKQNAYVITAWLTSALMMLDGMLAAAAPKAGA